MIEERDISIDDIEGLTSPDENPAYQNLIRDHVFKAIVIGTHDKKSGQAIIRNEDIILALIDIQAMMASSSNGLNSPTKLREWSSEMAKRLRVRTAAFQEEVRRGNPVFDNVIDVTHRN